MNPDTNGNNQGEAQAEDNGGGNQNEINRGNQANRPANPDAIYLRADNQTMTGIINIIKKGWLPIMVAVAIWFFSSISQDLTEGLKTANQGLESKIEEVKGKFGGLEDKIKEVDDKFSGLNDNLKGLQDTLGKVEGNFKGVNDKFSGLKDNLKGLKETLGKVEGNFKGLDDKFIGLEGKFSGLESKFSGLEGQFSGLESKFSGLEGQFSGLESNFSGLGGKLGNLDEKFNGLGRKFDELGGNFKDLRTELYKEFEFETSKVEKVEKSLQGIIDELQGTTVGGVSVQEMQPFALNLLAYEQKNNVQVVDTHGSGTLVKYFGKLYVLTALHVLQRQNGNASEDCFYTKFKARSLKNEVNLTIDRATRDFEVIWIPSADLALIEPTTVRWTGEDLTHQVKEISTKPLQLHQRLFGLVYIKNATLAVEGTILAQEEEPCSFWSTHNLYPGLSGTGLYHQGVIKAVAVAVAVTSATKTTGTSNTPQKGGGWQIQDKSFITDLDSICQNKLSNKNCSTSIMNQQKFIQDHMEFENRTTDIKDLPDYSEYAELEKQVEIDGNSGWTDTKCREAYSLYINHIALNPKALIAPTSCFFTERPVTKRLTNADYCIS